SDTRIAALAERTTTRSAVDHEALERPEQSSRPPRDVREAQEVVGQPRLRFATPELLLGDRPPELVDDLRRLAGDLLHRPVEVLRPEAEPRLTDDVGVAADHVQLRVVEER